MHAQVTDKTCEGVALGANSSVQFIDCLKVHPYNLYDFLITKARCHSTVGCGRMTRTVAQSLYKCYCLSEIKL